MQTCSSCENFNIQSFTDKFPIRAYPARDVIKAAESGCTFCQMLLINAEEVKHSEYFINRWFQQLLWRSGNFYLFLTVSGITQDSGDSLGIQMTQLNFVRRSILYRPLDTLHQILASSHHDDIVSFNTAADPGWFSRTKKTERGQR